jgi:two-component system, NtrC family, sensor kinase
MRIWLALIGLMFIHFSAKAQSNATPDNQYNIQQVFSVLSIPPDGILLDKGWKFQAGDNPQWAQPDFDDSQWQSTDPTQDIHYFAALRQAQIGWFRLHLDVDTSLLNKPLAFRIAQIGASEVYLNGQLLYKVGMVNTDSRKELTFNPNYNPYSFQFKDQSHQVLAIRYSFTKANPYLNNWGFGNQTFALLINTMPDSINRLIQDKSYRAFMEFSKVGFLLFLGLLHLFFFISYPAQRTNLYYSLYTSCQAVGYLLAYFYFLPTEGHAYFYLIFLTENIMWLLFAFWSNVAVYSFAKQKKDILFWVLIIGMVIALPLSKWAYSWGGYFLPIYLVFAALNAARVSWIAVRNKIAGAWLVLVGWLGWTVGLSTNLGSIYASFRLPAFLNNIYIRDAIFNLGIVLEALPFSILLALEYARTNRSLKDRIVEVEQLSQKTLAQEQEKQQILTAQKEVLEQQVTQRTAELKQSLHNLKATQVQLIQSEKMASLGELTAGIAHEIQNPLNFVNNFSETNAELLEELEQELNEGNLDEAKTIAKNVKENEQKISNHGRRADSIVKNMLQHSRSSKGERQPTDINALVDEYLRLAYHGLRAKDKSFNADFNTAFDERIGKINIVPQEIGRVLLNLFNNAFYAVHEQLKKLGTGYEPRVVVSTERTDDTVEITVKDNGMGISKNLQDKIFQPFFTTKPTGDGTGLGLSLSYDIVKAHGGQLKVESDEGQGTAFIISLPLSG